jgi:hypothetical protein
LNNKLADTIYARIQWLHVFNVLQVIFEPKSVNIPARISIYEPELLARRGHMKDTQSKLPTSDILSQMDIILPSQYFGAMGSAGLSGEQRLMLAVLIDAINVLQSRRSVGRMDRRRNFGEAAQWVNTRGTSHPFSFDSVCDALEIDSAKVRSHLRVLTVRPANSGRCLALGRLRIKELSRSRHMTANKFRRRERVPRIVTALLGSASASTSRWDGQSQDCTADTDTASRRLASDLRAGQLDGV